MKVSSIRWFSQLTVIAAVSTCLLVAGFGLRLLARHNLEMQNSLIDVGVDYSFPDTFKPDMVANEDIKFLLSHDFFREKVVEPAAVVDAKRNLGAITDGLYFPEIWDLFWYLNFIHDENALYSALETSIKGNAFASSGRCVDVRICQVQESSSNVNRVNGEKLFDLFYKFFIGPALDDLKHLNGVDAQRRATDAISLARLVDFDDNISFPSYDRVLVAGAFLTLPEVLKGNAPTSDDVEKLLEMVELGADDPDPIMEKRAAVYVRGISALRRGCFSQSSNTFSNAITASDQDAVSELFAFLALRALAHPIIAQRNLDASGPDPLSLLVNDCDQKIGLDTIRAKFDQSRQVLEKIYIHHRGLQSDIEYYSKRFPRTPAETVDLHMQVAALKKPAIDEAKAIELKSTSESENVKGEVGDMSPPMENAISSPAGYQWPLSGKVVKAFSVENKGIEIETSENEDVMASKSGRVIYAGEFRDLGKTVLIQHDGGDVTVYGRLGEVLVVRGTQVDRGFVIAKANLSFNGEKPALHFELRHETAPIDPITKLP